MYHMVIYTMSSVSKEGADWSQYQMLHVRL